MGPGAPWESGSFLLPVPGAGPHSAPLIRVPREIQALALSALGNEERVALGRGQLWVSGEKEKKEEQGCGVATGGWRAADP